MPFAALTLGSRDQELLEALTLRVRLLTVRQAARTWWRSDESNTRRRLRELEGAGLLAPIRLVARPELELHSPLFEWRPTEPSPEFGALSYRLQSRWKEPASSTPAVMATEGAANFFGGYFRSVPKRVEHTHDVHLASVYLWYKAHRPQLATQWVSEAWIKQSRPDAPGEKLPDAMIRTPYGSTIVDFGGSYTKQKLADFHAFCVRRSTPYELW